MLDTILSYIPKLLPYLSVTFEYVFFSLLFGSILAVLLVLMKLSTSRIARAIGYGYTTLMRCIPSLILLFLIFYGLPALLKSTMGINIQNANVIIFVIAAFTLFLGASLSEVIRSAYNGLDHGQYEAAVCVGLTNLQAFRRIMLPQIFYLMIPNLGNTVQYLIKEGSLGYIIGLVDVMGKAYLLNSNTLGAYVLQIYLALALIYWAISILVERVFALLERRFEVGYVVSPSYQHDDGKKATA